MTRRRTRTPADPSSNLAAPAFGANQPSSAWIGWAAATVSFAVSLVVYARTLHPGLPGPDSGELITVARSLGIAHPPGYPLYTLLAHGFDRVLSSGSPAWHLNLLSALLQSGAAAVLCVVVTRLTFQPWAGLIASVSFAFARTVWKGALVAEVFPLNDLMASFLWLGFVGLLADAGLLGARPHERAKTRWVLLLLGITAAIPAHHPSLLILALPLDLVALAIVIGRPRALLQRIPGYRPPAVTSRTALAAFAVVVLALAPLVYLPLAAARDPAISWGNLTTIEGLVRHLARSEYGTLSLAPTSGETRAIRHAWAYLHTFPVEFAWWSAIVAFAGGAVLMALAWPGRRPSRWPAATPLLAAVAGTSLLQAWFFTRVGLDLDRPYTRGVVERFYPLPDVTVSLLVGVGAAWLITRFPAKARSAAGVVFLTAAVLAPWFAHGRSVDQSGNTFNEDLGRNVLASLPPDAVLFSVGDIFTNDLEYLTLVENLRPDIVIVDQDLLRRPWYVASLRRRHPDVLPPFTTSGDRQQDVYAQAGASANVRWIDHLKGRRPVAFIGEYERSYAARYRMVEHGLVMIPYASGSDPSVADQARASLDVLARCRLDSYFRAQDPSSAEADSRWRITGMMGRLCLTLCDSTAQSITRAEAPGLASLGHFLDRYSALDAVDDPEVLRASGFLHVFHPEFRDAGRAISDLSRYLGLAPPGPSADGARRLLNAIRGGGS